MADSRTAVTLLLTLLSVGGGGVRFSIDAQLDQIFRIIEQTETAMETSDIAVVMTPADFNYIIPISLRMTCKDGLMVVQDMRRIHQEDIYMDAANVNETHISARFTVTEMDFKYDSCWLSLIIPVPMWLRGKILKSTYHVEAKLSYLPSCEFTITKASLESYEKMSLNVFNWIPGGLGDVMTEMLTRNMQDRIHDTVSKSIEKSLLKLSKVYNACVAFPAMGRLTELVPRDEEMEEERDDPLLEIVDKDEDTDNGLSSEKEAELEPTIHEHLYAHEQNLASSEQLEMQRDDAITAASEKTGVNDDIHVTEVKQKSIKRKRENKCGENTTNKNAAGCLNSNHLGTSSSVNFYEIIRSNLLLNQALKKNTVFIGGMCDTEDLHDERNMKLMKKPLFGRLKNTEPSGKKERASILRKLEEVVGSTTREWICDNESENKQLGSIDGGSKFESKEDVSVDRKIENDADINESTLGKTGANKLQADMDVPAETQPETSG